MRNRGIIQTAEEVKAWLSGRKAMFRVVVKRPPGHKPLLFDFDRARVDNGGKANFYCTCENEQYLHVPFCHKDDGWRGDPKEDTTMRVYCPYQVGDRIFIKETWSELGFWNEGANDIVTQTKDKDGHERNIIYREKSPDFEWLDGDEYMELRKDGTFASHWKSSIHMPFWASRIHREVTAVRAERLQDIWEWVVNTKEVG